MKKMVSALVAAVLAGCILTGCGGTTAADPGGTGTAEAGQTADAGRPAAARSRSGSCTSGRKKTGFPTGTR